MLVQRGRGRWGWRPSGWRSRPRSSHRGMGITPGPVTARSSAASLVAMATLPLRCSWTWLSAKHNKIIFDSVKSTGLPKGFQWHSIFPHFDILHGKRKRRGLDSATIEGTVNWAGQLINTELKTPLPITPCLSHELMGVNSTSSSQVTQIGNPIVIEEWTGCVVLLAGL